MTKPISLTKYLRHLALTPAHAGYNYIITTLHLIEGLDNYSITGIYRDVAKLHNTTPGGIERCIRTAINAGIGNPQVTELWYEEFGALIDKEKGCITNKNFLATLSLMISNGEITYTEVPSNG